MLKRFCRYSLMFAKGYWPIFPVVVVGRGVLLWALGALFPGVDHMSYIDPGIMAFLMVRIADLKAANKENNDLLEFYSTAFWKLGRIVNELRAELNKIIK